MKYYKLRTSDRQLSQGLFVHYIDQKMYRTLGLIRGEKPTGKIQLPLQLTMLRTRKAKTFFPEKQEFLSGPGGGSLSQTR